MLCLAVTNSHAEEPEELTLETVTVTAQKQKENIQEVPISMTVFDEISIEDRKIESVKDLAGYTSNLYLEDKAGGYYTPSIRGVTNPIGSAFAQPVSVIVDGILVSGSYGFDETLLDIERIEVLKGPQGTLYGKEAEAGVINVITKKPDNEIRGKIGAEFGSDNKRQYTLNISRPIVEDKFYVGVSAKHYEKDGFIENTLLGGYTNDKENNYGRVHLRYTPCDNLDISLISSRLEYDNGNYDYVSGATNTDDRRVSADSPGYDRSDITAHALKVSYDINAYLLESITTYRYLDYDASTQYNTGTGYYDSTEIDKLAQEFRLSSIC